MTRRAFTLVELLVAISVIAILAGMVTAALSSVNADARRKRCETQLIAIDSFLHQRMEAFVTKRVDLNTVPPDGVSFPEWTYLGRDRARARLIAMRDLMRMELPDRKTDLAILAPSSHRIQAGVYQFDQDGQLVPGMAGRMEYPVPVSQTLIQYRRAVARLTGQPMSNWADSWTEQHESAECLYLILATTTIAGRNGLELVRKEQIADTDGDGVPEILDPWGRPVVWMRWPVGYWLLYEQRNDWSGANQAARIASVMEKKAIHGMDQFDPMRVDWRNIDRGTDPINAWNDTFNCRHLIVSAGPSGQFDMMLRSSFGTGSDWQYGAPLIYGSMTWNAPTPHNAATYHYPDPFPRNYPGVTDPSYSVDYFGDPSPFAQGQVGGWLGAYYDANGDGVDDSGDNVFSARAP